MPRKRKTSKPAPKRVKLSATDGEYRPVARVLRARYDNAATTNENYRHWANASDLAGAALGDPETRRQLRNRCRYECRNNSWARGIKDTLANDTVGTGPRLQLLPNKGDDREAFKELRKRVEMDWWVWSQEIRLAEKLRTMRAARVDSGEIFGLIVNNPGLANSIKLDLRLAETEQVTSPFTVDPEEALDDGIERDEFDNPTRYWVLKENPGSLSFGLFFGPEDFDRYPAASVLHYYKPDRASQRRGVPDLTPAIDQFAELRRTTKAVIAALETAADFAAVIYSDTAPDPSAGTTTVEAMDTVELVRRAGLTLPQGWKLGQIHSEHPNTVYDAFVKCKLAEIARCLQVPLFVAGLDARDANMSSAYVVVQTYTKTIEVDRSDIDRLLDRLLDTWLIEWQLANVVLPVRINRVWQWDEVANHADPAKVANARATELACGVTNIPREYAKKGQDWEDEQEAAAKSMGMTVEEYRKRLADQIFKPATAPAGEAAEEEDEPAPSSNGNGRLARQN